MQVAIDASILVALLNPHDAWHAQAITLRDALIAAGLTPMYFDCVTAEAISAVARRLHEKGRGAQVPDMLARLENQVPQNLITWIFPDVPHLYPHALELIRASAGELNFNDALIALACRERNIPAIASFDPDFDQVDWLKRLAVATDIGQ